MQDNKAVIFEVANGEYAILVDHVMSIEKEEAYTVVPQLPSFVKGITKVREELIPVIDLQQVLYNQATTSNENNKLMVLHTLDMAFGVIVKEAKEIVPLPVDSIKEAGFNAYQRTEYITGVTQIENKLVLIIDPSILLDSLEGIKDIKDYMKKQAAKG